MLVKMILQRLGEGKQVECILIKLAFGKLVLNLAGQFADGRFFLYPSRVFEPGSRIHSRVDDLGGSQLCLRLAPALRLQKMT